MGLLQKFVANIHKLLGFVARKFDFMNNYLQNGKLKSYYHFCTKFHCKRQYESSPRQLQLSGPFLEVGILGVAKLLDDLSGQLSLIQIDSDLFCVTL